MAYTAVQICAAALVRLGAQPIQAFDEGTDIATTCDTIYYMKKDYILSSYPWSFTKKFAQLSQLAAAPTAQWDYQYTLPADRVSPGFSAVYASEDVSAIPIQDYTIIGNRLMSDSDEIWVEYQYSAEESTWPPYFVELMVVVMMDEICTNVTDNTGLKQTIQANLYGIPSEFGVGGLYGRAMGLDSRDNPVTFVLDSVLLEARFGRGAV